ncbi:hypothetical protein QTO34_010958 [Cnephaeus nilssonii]|uniref:Uncharacterized protein n=1 Tax=Cnephaeus nilssonii TaxID=3371016 RepID=A0AA40HCS7_CNENI|nr:hypothetical protein QTO34_010958 [Eptesicus nilssonii]
MNDSLPVPRLSGGKYIMRPWQALPTFIWRPDVGERTLLDVCPHTALSTRGQESQQEEEVEAGGGAGRPRTCGRWRAPRAHRRTASAPAPGDGVADHVLQEHLEHPARLLVDEPGDALDAAAPRQAPDGGLGDALDVVAQHLAVALGAALAQALPAFAATGHGG